MPLPEITVLRDRYVPSPESDGADQGLPPDAVSSVPFRFAMSEAWPSDAHCTQYECVAIDGIEIRLAGDALCEGVPVRMVWLIGDVDGPDHAPTPEWRAVTEEQLARAPFAWYATRGGYRVIARLAEPLVLEYPRGHDEWHDRYLAWCDEVLAAWGLDLDRQANDWTRLFRLPCVVRDGRPVRVPLHGIPPDYDLPEVGAPVAGVPEPAPGPITDRAIAVAARMPASVAGHGGDRALFNVAGELATLLESADEIQTVLTDVFNPRCAPPWDARKLAREARTAAARVAELGGAGAWARRRAERGPELGDSAAFDLPLATDQKGKPLATLDNILIALEAWFAADLWLDEMSGRIQCDRARNLLECSDGVWRDGHTTALHAALQRSGIRVARHDVRHVVDLHAGRHARNPLADELARLAEQWDGSPRVDGALVRYWGCTDSPTARAAGRVALLSLAARGLQPGTKVDTCLVLIGGQQGTGKSTSLRILALRDEWFGDSDLPLGDKDARQLLRGKWIWEIQEMATIRKREAEQVKAFISQTYDTFRAAYKESPEDVLRTCVLFGTSNPSDILQDPTGSRRFMPVVTGTLSLDRLRRDRDQLIGEAVARVLGGEQHWPTAAEVQAFEKNAPDFAEVDPWLEAAARWLNAKPERADVGFTATEFFSFSGGAVPLEESRQGTRDMRRVSGVLRQLGLERVRARRHGKREYLWLRKGAGASTAPDAEETPNKELN